MIELTTFDSRESVWVNFDQVATMHQRELVDSTKFTKIVFGPAGIDDLHVWQTPEIILSLLNASK